MTIQEAAQKAAEEVGDCVDGYAELAHVKLPPVDRQHCSIIILRHMQEWERSQWKDASKELPEMNKAYSSAEHLQSDRVQIFTGHYVAIGRYADTYTRKKTRWEDSTGRVVTVTHWRELPTPPEVTK